jgi:hypothetical protein
VAEGEEMAPRVAGPCKTRTPPDAHLALTPQGELAVVHRPGALSLAPGVLMGPIQVAARRPRVLESWLNVHVLGDWALKKVEVR